MPSSPQVTLADREQDDLELLLTGALAPLTGFGPPESGVTVIAPVAADEIEPGDTVRLLDVEGAPLADLPVEATYPTSDGVGLVGSVRPVAGREPRPFEDLYRPPDQVRAQARGALVVPTDCPLSAADIQRVTAEAGDQPVLILALAGAGMPRGASAVGLIRASVAAAEALPRAEVVAVPLARREGASARDTVLDRVLAAYAGQGTDGAPAGVLHPTGEGPLPDSVTAAIQRDRPTGTEQGVVLLFTGLSGSGKSTIARGVRNAVLEAGDRTVTTLDGDVVRRHLSAGLGFSRQDRDTNIRRIGWVAAEIGRHGGMAIASPIAPFAATRSAVRQMAEQAGAAFVLVHVATPLAECERRDRKGLYARARAGEIPDFTGISSPYEEPTDADVRVDTTTLGVPEAVGVVLDELRRRGLIR